MKKPLKTVTIHGDTLQGIIESAFHERRAAVSNQQMLASHGGFSRTTVHAMNGMTVKTISAPCLAVLWFLASKLKNILPNPDDEKFVNFTKIYDKKVKFVKHLQRLDINSGIEKLFTAYFEVPVHAQPSIYRISLDIDHGIVIGFPIGPQCAVSGTWLIGEVSLELPAGNSSGGIGETKFKGKGLVENERFLFDQSGVHKGNEIVAVPVFEDISPYLTLLVRVRRDKTYPFPGELLCLAVGAGPGVIVFKQDTNPALFSGNWFSTQAYTSGIVKAVTPSTSKIENDFTYDVVVEGIKMSGVLSSDFYEYKVDDRVTLIKNITLDTKNMDHTQVDANRDNWQIAPITFYSKGLQWQI